MYQQGSTAISNGASTVSVVFPQVFAATPAAVWPFVRNLSADVSKTALSVIQTTSTRQGFTATLSGTTNSANYELVWVAGDAQAVMDALLVQAGVRTHELPNLPALDRNFALVGMSTVPGPSMKLVQSTAFWNAVVRRASAIPASAFSGMTSGMELIADPAAGFLYVSTSSGWGRIAIDLSSDWNAQPFFVPFRERQVALSHASVTDAGSSRFDVEYATPFPVGNAPVLTAVQFTNTSGGAVTLLNHQVIASDRNGFSLQLSGSPDLDNTLLYYLARQLP